MNYLYLCIEPEGRPGTPDFALWLAFENATDRAATLSDAHFSIVSQVGNWHVNRGLTAMDPLPEGRFPPHSDLRICLYRGSGLPPPEVTEAEIAARRAAPGPQFPAEIYRSMEGLLAAELCAFTVLLKVTLDAPPPPPQGWLARLLRAPAPKPAAKTLGPHHMETSVMNTGLARGRLPRADRIDLDRKPW